MSTPQDNETPLTAFLKKHINAIAPRKSQRQIAREVGWARPNILSMIKSGDTRLPLATIPKLAAALEVDPAQLFRLAMQDLWPDIHAIVAEIFGTVLTQNEREIIDFMRSKCPVGLPPLSNELKRSLHAALIASQSD